MRLRLRLVSTAALCAALLAGCTETFPIKPSDGTGDSLRTAPRNGKDTGDRLKSIAAQQERLDHVAAPLLIKNHDRCRQLTRPLLGFTAKNKYSYSPPYAEAAHDALGLGDMLQVTGIMAGSAAARSGLQRGDSLLSAGNRPMPQGQNAEYEAPAILVPLIASQPSIAFTVLRNGGSQTVSVPATRACGMRIELGNTDSVNSYADGRRILITRGMVRFVRSDEELAYVIAREMAHNILGHPQRLGSAAAARDQINLLMPVFPASGGVTLKPMPRDMDVLADRLALHLLVRAGYKIDGVAAFWQRLAQQVPATVSDGHTALHPETAPRIAAIEKTAEDLKFRRAPAKTSQPQTSSARSQPKKKRKKRR